MERLTVRNSEGHVCRAHCFASDADAWNLAARYEDTGLTPEEISNLVTEVKGLRFNLGTWQETAKSLKNDLQSYKDAEGQWLFIKLPYKSWDTIYDIHFGNALKCKVSGYECDADGRWFMKTQYGRIPMDELHEVYPTREEAEEALKGGGAE